MSLRVLGGALVAALVAALAPGVAGAVAAAPPAPTAASWQPVHRQGQTYLDGVTSTAAEHVWAVGSQLAEDGYFRPAAF